MALRDTLFSNLYSPVNSDFNIDVDELSEEHPRAEQPNCKITLRSHQLTLLKRCLDYENNDQYLSTFSAIRDHVNPQDNFKTNMGVIADRVGSGKSFVILSIIGSNDITNRDTTIVKSTGINNFTVYIKDTRRTIKTNIIVIPHNLSSQWEGYIKMFGTIASYKIINKQKLFDAFKSDEGKLEDYDLVVVTSTFFNKVAKLYADKNVRLQRIIFDEVDNLNIPSCSSIQAGFIWFVTASYGNVLHPRGYTKFDSSVQRYIFCANGVRNSGFIKNIFLDLSSNLPKELVKVLIVKNKESYVESSLQLPEVRHHIIKCKTPYTISILNGLVDKNVIESLNAGDMQTALSHINSNNKGSEENIISTLIEKFTKQMTNLQLRLNMTLEYVYDDDREREHEHSILVKRMDDLRAKVTQIKERVHDSNNCIICYDSIETKTITKCCQNSFCFKCIHMWINKKSMCPICKSHLVGDMLYTVYKEDNCAQCSSKISDDEMNECFDKVKNIEILLKNKKNAKVLIFSNFDTTFQKIIPVLNTLNMKYEFIKGNGDQIRAIVNRYKSDAVNVLLVNSRNYGTGMNLENTTDVIMLHKFDIQLETQIIGRAQRFGRVDPLNVYYMLHENEVK